MRMKIETQAATHIDLAIKNLCLELVATQGISSLKNEHHAKELCLPKLKEIQIILGLFKNQ